MSSFEKVIENKEKTPSVEVVLHIMRHGDKTKTPNISDDRQELTPKGREQAIGKSKEGNLLEQSLSFGSPRDRAKQTAILAMAGAQVEDLVINDFATLKQKVDESLSYGSKVGTDMRLNFFEGSEEYAKIMYDAYIKGEYIQRLVNESDKIAESLGDKESSTYSRQARAIAEIIKKYLSVVDNWQKIYSENGDKYKSNKLDRFLGTHQGVSESFVAKYLEMTDGIEARDEFVGIISSKGGFDLAEGYDIDIQKDTFGKKTARLLYEKIIGEGDEKKLYKIEKEIDIKVLEDIISSAK